MTTVLGFLATLLTAVLSRQLAEDFRAWAPTIVLNLIQFAVQRLPEQQRERFQEEWLSHAVDVPGEIGKLAVALGFVVAAIKITCIQRAAKFSFKRLGSQTIGFLTLLIMVPAAMPIVLLIHLQTRGPILVKREWLSANGRALPAYEFALDGATKLGRFLSHGSLHTLPIILNIVRGEVQISDLQPCRSFWETIRLIFWNTR
jgi:hypothetical protein